MFLLCAFADREYWASCLEPLLYPTGTSFFRPFSYRQNYISSSLWNVFADGEQLKRLLPLSTWNSGIFGIRFRDEAHPDYRGQFIPLRKVTLTEVKLADTAQVSFRVDQYLSLNENRQLRSISLDGIVAFTHPENTLMIEVPNERLHQFKFPSQDELPSHLWDRLADDPSLSDIAKTNFLGTTVLRLVMITERGHTTALTPSVIEKTEKRPRLYGFQLRSGHIYDLDLAYTRITKQDVPNPAQSNDFAVSSPGEHFDTARDRLVVSGNYRRETIWVQPKIARPGPVLLEWQGVKKTDRRVSADPVAEKILGLRIPIHISDRFWTRQRLQDGSLALLFLVLAVIAFYLAVTKGATSAPGKDTLAEVLSGVGAFFAGLFGSFLTAFIRGKPST